VAAVQKVAIQKLAVQKPDAVAKVLLMAVGPTAAVLKHEDPRAVGPKIAVVQKDGQVVRRWAKQAAAGLVLVLVPKALAPLALDLAAGSAVQVDPFRRWVAPWAAAQVLAAAAADQVRTRPWISESAAWSRSSIRFSRSCGV
jgi:hypothetical protein